MSLINEALKRTRDASQPGTPRPQPVEYRITSSPNDSVRKMRVVLWIVGVIVVVPMAGFCWYSLRSKKPVETVHETMDFGHKVADSPMPDAESTPPANAVLPPPPAPAPVMATPAPEPVKAELVAPIVTAISVEPVMPKLTLEGITSDGKVREAMINGISLHVDEDIEGAKITAIEARLVRLKCGEKEIVLRMQ